VPVRGALLGTAICSVPATRLKPPYGYRELVVCMDIMHSNYLVTRWLFRCPRLHVDRTSCATVYMTVIAVAHVEVM
jgi:hypothetical protein